MEAKDSKGFMNFDFFADLTGEIPSEPQKGIGDIGERIRKLREEKGLSLEELSSLTGFEIEFLSSPGQRLREAGFKCRRQALFNHPQG